MEAEASDHAATASAQAAAERGPTPEKRQGPEGLSEGGPPLFTRGTGTTRGAGEEPEWVWALLTRGDWMVVPSKGAR